MIHMATLIKANNTTALNLAGAWTPSQVPTAADDLVFNATYLYATGATFSVGGDVASASVEFGPVTSPAGALNLAQTGSAGRRLWTSNLFDFSEANANWQPTDANVTLSSAGDSIAFRLGRPYTVSVAIDSLKDVSVDVIGDVAGSASLALQPGMSMDGYSFYAVPLTADAAGPTVPGTENAVLSPYPNVVAGNVGGFAVIQGHPTLPTAITLVNNYTSRPTFGTYTETPPTVAQNINAPASFAKGSDAVTVGNITYFAYPSSGSAPWGLYSGQVGRPVLAAYDWSTKSWQDLGFIRPNVSGYVSTSFRIAYDNIGNLYVSGAFTQIINGATTITANRIAKYNIATKTWSNLGTGAFTGTSILSLACDSVGNLYVGGFFTQIGGLACVGFAKWTPGTSTWSNPGSMSASTQVNDIAIDSSNNVHITGSFTTVAGTASQRYARWNPGTSTWTRYATGLGATGGLVRVFGTTAYIAGAFTSAFGVATNGVVALNTSTGVASARSLASGGVAAVFGLAIIPDGTLFVNWYNSSTTFGFQKWTGAAWSSHLGSASSIGAIGANLYNGPGSTIISLAQAATTAAYGQSNIEPPPAAVLGNTASFSASVASFDPTTTKFTLASNSAVGFQAYGTTATDYPIMAIYKAASIQAPVELLHFGGTKTYVVPAGQAVTVQFLNYTSSATTRPSMFVLVRRGGALLESPEITTSGQVPISIQSIQAAFAGDSAVVSLLPGVSDAKLAANSNLLLATSSLTQAIQNKKMGATVLNASVPSTSTEYATITMTEDVDSLTVGASGTQASGSAPSPSFAQQVVLGANAPRMLWYPGTAASLIPGALSENVPVGHPRSWPANFTLGRSSALTIASPYFRVTDAFTVSAAAVLWQPSSIVSRGQLRGIGNPIVDWSSNTGLIIGTGFREVRVSSFAPFPVLNQANFYYTGAGETVSSALLAGPARFISGPNSGPLVFALTCPSRIPTVPAAMYLDNNYENNRWTTIIGVGTSAQPLFITGNGTLTMESAQYVYMYGNPTVTLDFSAHTAGRLSVTQFNGGTLVLKGIPGQDLSLYIAGSVGSQTGYVYNAKLVFDANGGTSISVLASTSLLGNTTNPLLIEGLSATNTIVSSSLPSSTLWGASSTTTTGSVCILGSNGDIDYALAPARFQPITPYTTYAAMPTSGGTNTDIVSQSGSTTLTGNVTARVLKLIPTSASDTLALSSFTLTSAGVLLAGNQGGTYTISGSRLTATHIINASNTELQLLAPIGSTKVLGNVVSFGSATTTYRETAANTGLITANTVTKIYAGSDNLQPQMLTLGTDFTVVQEVQFLGSGTGRSFPHALKFRPGGKITCSADWTFPEFTNDQSGSASNAGVAYWIFEVNAPTSVTISVQRIDTSFNSMRLNKTGPGKLSYQSIGGIQSTSTGQSTQTFHYVEEGTLEIALTSAYAKNADAYAATLPVQLEAGTSVVLNSAFDHPLNWVIWGDGAVVKNNTNTVRCLARLSQTGGFTVNTGEYDAQFRYAVGDGDVTLAGGTLRASDAGKDQYILEVAGDFIFAGGSLALGDDYV